MNDIKPKKYKTSNSKIETCLYLCTFRQYFSHHRDKLGRLYIKSSIYMKKYDIRRPMILKISFRFSDIMPNTESAEGHTLGTRLCSRFN
jgi:hypothetical protein